MWVRSTPSFCTHVLHKGKVQTPVIHLLTQLAGGYFLQLSSLEREKKSISFW